MSKSPDILNLDEVKGHRRAIVLDGVEYELEDLSVDGFITTLRESEEVDKRIQNGETLSITDQIEMHIKSVTLLIPSLPKEKLATMSVRRLGAIVAFAQETAQEGAPKKPESSDEVQGKEQGIE